LKINIKNPGVFIKNEKIVKNLGEVEYLVTDMASLLTSRKLQLSSLVLYDQVYTTKQENHIENEMNNTEKTKNLKNNIESEVLFDGGDMKTFEELQERLENDYQHGEATLLAIFLSIYSYFYSRKEYSTPESKAIRKDLLKLNTEMQKLDKYLVSVRIGKRNFEFELLWNKIHVRNKNSAIFMVKCLQHNTSYFVSVGCERYIEPSISDIPSLEILKNITQSSLFQEMSEVCFAYKRLEDLDCAEILQDLRHAKRMAINAEVDWREYMTLIKKTSLTSESLDLDTR
jgi:Tfp pilus assembly protein PilZ